jgi:hypothetical protein
MGTSTFDFAGYNRFQRNLAHARPNEWPCRAGSRYLYVCEDGLVHWCSQQRGRPGVPVDQYGQDDLEREYHSQKSCAPFCTVGCVHRVAQLDELREKPLDTLTEWFRAAHDLRPRLPVSIRMLTWLFVTNRRSDLVRRTAARLFGVK